MNSKPFVALACVLALCACRDQAPAPTAAAHTLPTAPSRTELAGIVVRSGTDISPVYLQMPDALVPLQGGAASPMTSVIGAEVQVRGTWDGNAALIVESFTVTAVNGLPAIDGILEAMTDCYALRLVDGSVHRLTAAPAELQAHVGARVWVTESADATEVAFGVIQVAQ